jgi:hypothetical protein
MGGPVVAEAEAEAEAEVDVEAEAEAAAKRPLGKEALLQVRREVAQGAALDETTSIGYQMLMRMGWIEGQGLGRHGKGAVLPVAVRTMRLLEGVGLGCDKGLPEAKVFSKNVEERITEFLSDPSSSELAFNPDLSKADRALVHTLAQKHNLKHQSSGKGDERFITVYKRTHVPSAEAARMNEHAVEEQVQLR